MIFSRATIVGTSLSLALSGPPLAAAAEQPGPDVSYLVCPPENRSEDRSLYWLGEVFAEGMEQHLDWAGVEHATRDERRSIEREMGIHPLVVPTIATRLKEAEELAVSRAVVGHFDTSGAGTPETTVTLSLMVIDPAGLERGPVRRVGPLPLGDLAGLQEAAGAALLDVEGIEPPAGAPPVPRAREASPAAYEARIKSMLEEDPEKKASFLRRALRADASYLFVRLELAELLVELGRDDEAMQVLTAETLTGTDALAAAAESLLGRLHLKAARPAEAVAALRRSLQWSDEAPTRILLARALAEGGNFEVAAAELELARRLDPEDPEIDEVRSHIERKRREGEETNRP